MATQQNAIISVSNKSGLPQLGNYLLLNNYNIYSTGGTYRKLLELFPNHQNQIISVSSLTNFPEILGGRVKTLHPKVYGGILSCRDNTEHMEEIDNMDIPLFNLIVVNLYPFQETVAKSPENHQQIIENIDIGGVSLIRAGAKNCQDVVVLISPDQYSEFITLDKDSGITNEQRMLYA